jgi:DNA invertase Pin-like site-specific DNA recombinase
MNGRFVAYYRVSTAKQGRSGLGLQAQRKGVEDYLNGGSWTLAAEFTEIESGKRDTNRPKLAEAMKLCRMTGATLVIAKIDRLSRDAHFLIGLQKAGVDFVAADMPNANRLTVGIMALLAQEEREMISRRTREALAAAKARGTKLGGWRGGPIQDTKAATAGLQRKAEAFAAEVGPMVVELRGQGLSLQRIADTMTERGMFTPRRTKWTATAVLNLLRRVAT